MLFQIAFKIVERFDIGIHSFALGIGNEDDSIDALQYKLAAGIVIDLTGHCVEVKPGLESAHGSKIKRQEVEEERSVSLGRKADQFAFGLRSGRIIYVLQVGGLAAQSRPVVDNFAVDLARCVVDERQGYFPYRVPASYPLPENDVASGAVGAYAVSAEQRINVFFGYLSKWRIE